MQTIYETTINQLGPSVGDFLSEKMFILFGQNAPAELADYCLLIDVNAVSGEIETDDVLYLNDVSYRVTAVGSVVKQNLNTLGHITLKFDGALDAELPGTLHLEESDISVPKAGTSLKIVKK